VAAACGRQGTLVIHVLIVLGIIVILVLFVFASPTTACRCAGRCRHCKGTGRRFRFGARLVRRVIVLAYKQPWRERGER
jgi:hypothetical protein